MTPRELITTRRCTAGCIAATTRTWRCGCPCGGAFHGLVVQADVSALIEARRSGVDLRTDLEVIERAAA